MNRDENMNEGAELSRRIAERWLEETELLPLSVLALDHPEPVGGWPAELEALGIELLEDDLYRPAIRSEDARRLVEERRKWERENAVKKARRRQEEAQPVAVGGGIRAIDGATPLESIQAADPAYTTVEQEFGRGGQSVYTQLLDEELAKGRRAERDKRVQADAKKAARGEDG